MKRRVIFAILALTLGGALPDLSRADDFSNAASRFRPANRRVFEHSSNIQNRSLSFINRPNPFENRHNSFADARARFHQDRTRPERFRSTFSDRWQAQRLFAGREDREFSDGLRNDRFQNMRLIFEDPAFQQLNFNP